ncbi:MAG: UDP-N-acetylmuramate dehydrogenase [Chlamydiota bacterium]
MKLETGVSLSNFSTLGIGGAARFFVSVKTLEDLKEAFSFIRKEKVRFLMVGRGSNLLFDDRGFDGIVIHNKMEGFSIEGKRVRAEGGAGLPSIGRESVEKNLSGLEFAAGIPASVGGAICMNAGASGSSVSAVLESVSFLTLNGELKQFLKEDLKFDYRFSSLNGEGGAIVGATFLLEENLKAKEIMEKMMEYRKATQPYKERSAGCIFKNPKNGSAGYLIEKCGLKGKQIGGAKVSEIHANFLINAGGASSEDMKNLIAHVKEEVLQKSQVNLSHEVIYVPYQSGVR